MPAVRDHGERRDAPLHRAAGASRADRGARDRPARPRPARRRGAILHPDRPRADGVPPLRPEPLGSDLTDAHHRARSSPDG